MKEVTIGDKTFTVKEVKFSEFMNQKGLSQEDATKRLFQLSIGLTDAEYLALSLKEGVALVEAVNEVNGLAEGVNFQPTK